MPALKQVKSRLILKQDFPMFSERKCLDITTTFNMTERFYMDRNPDMTVELEDGSRVLIKKEFIAAIKEIEVVKQQAVEVNTTAAQE